jgi:hypothetical protein
MVAVMGLRRTVTLSETRSIHRSMRRLLPLLGLTSLLSLAGSPAFSAPPPAPGETGDILQARDPGETGQPGLRLAETGEAGPFARSVALAPGEAGDNIRAMLAGPCVMKQAQQAGPGETGTMLSSMDPGETGGNKVVAQADPGESGPPAAPLR